METEKTHLPVVPTFGRYAVLVAGAVNLGSGLAMPVTFSVMFPEWQETFNTSRAITAAVHSTSVGILYGGGVIAGCVVRRFGYRVCFFIGSILATMGMLLGAFATNIPFLWASVGFLSGCGFCLIQMPCIPSVTRAFQTHQGVAIAAVTTIGSLVILAMPALYHWLIQLYSWRGAFIIISGMCLNTLVLEMIMTSYVYPKSTSKTNISTSSHEAMKLVPFSDSRTSDTADCHSDSQNPFSQKLSEKFDDVDYLYKDDTQKIEKCGDVVCFTTALIDGREKDGLLQEYNIEKVSTPISDTSNSIPKFVQKNYQAVKTPALQICDPNARIVHGESINQKDSEQIDLTVLSYVSYDTKAEIVQTARTAEKIPIDLNGVQIDQEVITSLKPSRIEAIRNSAWNFLLDPLALAILTQLGLVLTPQFSAQLLAMDIASNKGAPQHGLLLVTAFAVAASTGKALAGVLGLFRRLPSFLILGISGIVGSVSLAALGFVSSLPATLASIAVLGVSMGLTISIFPKCFLDLACMSQASYPLALGMGNSIQGVINFLTPILVGHMVDVNGTYALPFSILSVISLAVTCMFFVVYRLTRNKSAVS